MKKKKNDLTKMVNQNQPAPAKKGFSPKVKTEIKSYALILICNIIRAIGIHYFVLPYNFAPGGVTGIATMLSYKLNWLDYTGYVLIILNAPLILLSFFAFSKRYAFKTMIGLMLSSAFLVLLVSFDTMMFDNYGIDMKEKLNVGNQTILAAIAGGVFSGIGLAMVIKADSSNGGTEVIGGLIQRKAPHYNVSSLISIMDSSVILVSFFVYDNGLAAVLLALIQVVCYSKVSDLILSGFKAAIKVEIITDRPNELAKEILEKLARGVTVVSAVGMYSHVQKYMLVSVIRKRQLPDLYKLLKSYPESFAYVLSASEVIGRGFSSLPPSKPQKTKISGVKGSFSFKGTKTRKNTDGEKLDAKTDK